MQPHLLSPITNWLWARGESLLDSVGDYLMPAIGFHEESYDAEEREDAEMKRDHPNQWADLHFNAARADWNPATHPSAYTIVSTKGGRGWQYTYTGQWLVRDGLLRQVKLRAHVHYYVDTQASWRRGSGRVLSGVRKVNGNFWVQGVDGRSALTPPAAVNGAPNLPGGWTDDYVGYLNGTQDNSAYNGHSVSHGVW